MVRIGHGPVGEGRVAKTVELQCVTANTRVETRGVLNIMKQKPRLRRRSQLKRTWLLVPEH